MKRSAANMLEIHVFFTTYGGVRMSNHAPVADQDAADRLIEELAYYGYVVDEVVVIYVC